MPRQKKQLSLFQDEYIAKTDERKPTLKQWIKAGNLNADSLTHVIRVIWFPGQWQNYTLECEGFRIRIADNHPLFAALRSELDDFTRGDRGMEVRLAPSGDGSFRLCPSDVVGGWFFISDLGIKFESE